MVKEVIADHHRHYVCAACGFRYKTKALAQACEAWCGKHKSCNLEITKHAVRNEDLST